MKGMIFIGRKRKYEHNMQNDRLYRVWNGMLTRCYNPNVKSYHRYGGRGITVCDEWRLDFLTFQAWALSTGYDYSKDRREQTLDRIDNDGNYCPENCRWVSIQENNANRDKTLFQHRPPVMWEINGVTKTSKEWCAEYGMNESTVKNRIAKQKMTPLEALTTPKQPYRLFHSRKKATRSRYW